MRKKKNVDMEKNSKEDTRIYDAMLERIIIKDKAYYISIVNGKLINNTFVYSADNIDENDNEKMLQVGKIIEGKILFF
jgi:hypothetical protein